MSCWEVSATRESVLEASSQRCQEGKAHLFLTFPLAKNHKPSNVLGQRNIAGNQYLSQILPRARSPSPESKARPSSPRAQTINRPVGNSQKMTSNYPREESIGEEVSGGCFSEEPYEVNGTEDFEPKATCFPAMEAAPGHTTPLLSLDPKPTTEANSDTLAPTLSRLINECGRGSHSNKTKYLIHLFDYLNGKQVRDDETYGKINKLGHLSKVDLFVKLLAKLGDPSDEDELANDSDEFPSSIKRSLKRGYSFKESLRAYKRAK